MYVRKGKTITHKPTGESTTHKSINAAKRASRQLQMEEDGALGRGSVRVIKK